MKFIIPQGKDFYCEFVVKEPGVSTPMDLVGATGTFDLFTLDATPCKVISDAPITVTDGQNGTVAISLTSTQTADLEGRRGFAEDGYPPIATYKGSLTIQADNPIYVEIPQVYVSESGAACPVEA